MIITIMRRKMRSKNGKVLKLDENSLDTLKRLQEIEDYHKTHPEIPYSDIFKRIMKRQKLRLIK